VQHSAYDCCVARYELRCPSISIHAHLRRARVTRAMPYSGVGNTCIGMWRGRAPPSDGARNESTARAALMLSSSSLSSSRITLEITGMPRGARSGTARGLTSACISRPSASAERARVSKAAGVDTRTHSLRSHRAWVGSSQPAGGLQPGSPGGPSRGSAHLRWARHQASAADTRGSRGSTGPRAPEGFKVCRNICTDITRAVLGPRRVVYRAPTPRGAAAALDYNAACVITAQVLSLCRFKTT